MLHDPLPTSHLSLTLSVIMTEALKDHLHLTLVLPLPYQNIISEVPSSIQPADADPAIVSFSLGSTPYDDARTLDLIWGGPHPKPCACEEHWRAGNH